LDGAYALGKDAAKDRLKRTMAVRKDKLHEPAPAEPEQEALDRCGRALPAPLDFRQAWDG
jgi:hypothetical protein